VASLKLIELWTAFKAERAVSVQPTTLATDYNQVGQWLERCPIQKTKKAREILAWVLAQTPTPSARKVAGYLRSMYRWAASDGVALVKDNPIKDYKMPKAPQRDEEVRIIPKDKMQLVLNALERKRDVDGPQWKLYAEWMLQTGMRTGEVRALKWTDIATSFVKVHSNYTLTHGMKNSTKTNKARKVPLNARCLEILEILPHTDDYLFPWDREAFQSFFRRRMQELHKQGEIETVLRPYDLRHTSISRWIEAGIPVTQAASWAGNTSEVIWKYYAGCTTEYEVPVL
jgi:integrase